MTDFASIGIEMDSRPVVEGTKALDALGEASARVEQKVRSSNGQMSDATKILQAQADHTKAAAQANAVLGNSTSALTAGQAQLIERFREQAVTVGMSRSQLMAYQAGLLGVTEQTKEAIAAVKAHEDVMRSASQAKSDATKSTNVLTDALKLLAAGYAALKIGEIIKDSAMQAARFETLGVVMGVVGKTAGYTKVQMDTASEAIAAQGITMLESRNSAIKLVQAHVDLTNASKLARIAQDAAVIGNINSSEAFERLVNGVSRGNVLILRNIGINVNLQAAYQQMADSLGKSTKELTENERVQARLNAVMERGSDIAGTYEASMDTAGKQILSMNRYVSDLKTVFGETFNEVLTVGVMAMTSGLKDANSEMHALSADGTLKQWGHDLTDVLVGIANAVSNVIVMTKLAAVEAAHATGKDGSAGIAAPSPDDSFGKRMSKRWIAFAFGASTEAGSPDAEKTYQETIAQLSGQLNKFDAALAVRRAATTAKEKAAADERLKIEQDYAKAASDILLKSAAGGVVAQEAARKQVVDLYNKTYVGTPSFRDTEGREPKDKIDRADSARLQNKLARIQEESAIDKSYAEFQMQLDDMLHKAGELGDEQYAKNRKENLQTIFISEQVMYDKELAALRAHHNSTEEERERNQKAIDDILGKQNAAQTKYSHDTFVGDESERLRQKSVAQASQDASNKYISGLSAEAEKLEQSNGAHEKSRSAIELETVARLDLAIAAQNQFMAEQQASGATAEEIAQAPVILKFLQDMRDARARIATAAATQEGDFFDKRAADQAIQGWQRAGASISESLRNAFGNGGRAAGEMFKAFAEGQAGQLRAQKELAAAKKLSDDNPEKIAAISRAQSDGAQAQLKSYGDIAGAAQSYFEKGSAGYQAMGAAAKVMHAAEVALSLVKGVNAVLTQGEGDPYSAFARMAAMAAVVAGLGVALTGGGGGGVSAADRQKAQGTGSVLGDSSAKSDSIAHSIAMTAANSSTQINYLAGMLTSLQAIQTNIGSFASTLLRTTDVSGSKFVDMKSFSGNGIGGVGALGGAGLGYMAGAGLTAFTSLAALGGPIGLLIGGIAGKYLGSALSSIFGGSKTLTDSGFTLGKTSLGSAMSNGVSGLSYADVTTAGGWFSSDKHDTQTTDLGAAADKQFSLIISSLADSITQASGLLGVCGDDFTDKLNSFVIDIGKVSLKGLTGDEQQKALEAVFSKLGDQMAEWAVAGLGQFAKVGEGYLETLTRVATDYAKLDASLASVGMTFGSVGIASVGARENLIALAGGIDKFQSDTASFAQNFLSKAEQMAPVAKFVDDQLAAMGLSFIKSRDQFKDEALGLDLATAAGQKEYAALMSLQAAFAATHAAIVDTSKSMQEVADERKGLQDQLDQLTMSSVQLLAKQRDALDESNRALFDQVEGVKAQAAALQAIKDSASALLGNVDSAYSVLQNVVNREKAAVQSSVDVHSAAVAKLQSLSQALHSTLDSIQSPEQKLFARASAQAEIHADLAITRAGGALSDAQIESLKKALGAVNQDAAGQFGSYQDYLRDLYQTQNDISKLGDVTDDSLSVEQAALKAAQEQLKSLDQVLLTGQQQVDELKGVNVNGLSLIQAMAGLTKAILAAKDNPIVGATSAITGAYQQYLGRAPDAEGMEWWKNAAAGGAPVSQIVDGIKGSTEASLNSLYQSVLGRAPDAEGLSFWMKAYGPTMDAAEQADWMKAAQAEMMGKLHPFSVGTNFVPEVMPALLHPGERVVPAGDNRLLMQRLASPAANADALAAAVDRLTAQVEKQQAVIERQEAALQSIAKSSLNTEGHLDAAINGQKPLATKVITSEVTA